MKTLTTVIKVLVVLAFLSLKLLLDDNMGMVNEVDVLPLAKQYADPTWIPGDWYLNQPSGYRLLFETLFGRLIVAWGFLATSLVGRLMCYGLTALGLVLIGRRLGLSLPLLLLAVGLFLYTDRTQGAVAFEWLLGGLEAKSVAYGLVLLAIALMLEDRYRWMALMLGLATSFHVLVGGWTFLVVVGWLAVRWNRLQSIRYLGLLLGIYLTASMVVIRPVLKQLVTIPTSSVTPSYIYVFLRLPHHLNPLAWSLDRWINPTIYLLVLALSISSLQRLRFDKLAEQNLACRSLFEFTLISLVPFLLGLAIAPFDSQGRLLQYYPFRLGDVMLPLNTCLLFACALQQTFTGRAGRVLILVCILLLTGACSVQFVTFHEQFLALRQFPQLDTEFKALCNWVRKSTPTDATVVTPPTDFVEFTWLAERPTIAKFKLLPQTKVGILDWYERLSDLSGSISPWSTTVRTRDRKKEIGQAMTNGYNHLTSAQADALMSKYQATYFMTGVEHQLDLPSAYHNSRYVLYSRKT